LQAGEEGRIFTWPGAAAEAFEYQCLDAAVDQCIQLRGSNARNERQDANVGRGLVVAVGQRGGKPVCQGDTAVALQCGKRVAPKTANLRAASRRHQRAVEVQVHTRLQAFAQGRQRTADVFPGIAVGHTGRQHRTGEHHRRREAQQLEAHGRCAVGQGVGAVQDQYGIAAGVYRLDHGAAQALPVGGVHVGAVDQW